MSYGGNTPKYKIPYPILGDTLDPLAEEQREEIVDNQLYGAIKTNSGGHGVIREGAYSAVSSGTGFYVTSVENKTQNLPTLEAFIDQIYINTVSPLLWTNLVVGTNYLYAVLVENATLSSLQYGDATTFSSLSATPPDDGLLVATATISGTSAVLDTEPSEKITIPTAEDHINDSTNPHGSTLSQSQLIVSGVTVIGNQVVRGALTVQGGINSTGGITANTGTYTTVNATTFTGTTVTLGTLTVSSGITFNAVSSLHANMNVASGVTIDGRDVSADGTTIDAHIANVSNPHATTAVQVGALSTTGGTLTGNVIMTSGTSIDGVDMSILQPLYAGPTSDASPLHTHSLSSGFNLPYRYIAYAPIYGDTVVSGNSLGTLTYVIDTGYNAYQWVATGPEPVERTLVLRTVVPEDFVSWAQISLYNKVTSAPAKVDVTMADTAGTAVSLTGGTALQNTSWTNSVVALTGGVWTAGSFFTLKVVMTGAISQTVYVGDLVFKYVPY